MFASTHPFRDRADFHLPPLTSTILRLPVLQRTTANSDCNRNFEFGKTSVDQIAFSMSFSSYTQGARPTMLGQLSEFPLAGFDGAV